MTPITKTEKIIIEHVLKGLTNRQIAELRDVKVQCIKFHLTNIYKKEGIKSRAQLIIKHIQG